MVMKKNYFKSLMQASLLLGAAFVISSCDDVIGQEDNPVASYVQWEAKTPKSIELTLGIKGKETFQIKAIAVSSATIVYESENTEIAKVNPVTGEITAVGVGETFVKAVISGASSAGQSVFIPEEIKIPVVVRDGNVKLTRNIDSYVEYTANNDSTFDVSKFFTPYPAEGNVISYKLLGVNTKEGEYGGTNLGTLTGKTFKVGANLENDKGISDTLYVAAEIKTKAEGYTLPKDAKLYQDTVMIVINEAIAYMNESNERTILKADKYTKLSKVLSDPKFDNTIKAGTYFVDANIGSKTYTPKISGDVTFILQNNITNNFYSIDDATDNSTLNFFRQANVKDGNGDDLPVGYFYIYSSSANNAITNFKAINIYGGTIEAYGRGVNKAAIINVGNINVYNDACLRAYGYSSSNIYATGIKLRDGGKLTVAGGTVYAYTNSNDIDNGFAVIGDVEVSKGVFTAENPTYRAVKDNLTAGGKILIKESNDGNTWTALKDATSSARYIQAQETSKTWK